MDNTSARKSANIVSNYIILLIVFGIFILSASSAEAIKHRTMQKKQNFLLIQEKEIVYKDVVIVDTNRWKPKKCMWIAKKEDMLQSNIEVVFPFSELFNAVCHVVVGVCDSHICFIHLTPLTSFLRKDTSELKKIVTNLRKATGNKKWSFQVYYFNDHGNEERFRSVLGEVLDESSVTFNAITPVAYSGGDLNLIFKSGQPSYSTKNLRQWIYDDASAKGSFNSIPIHAIE